MLATPVDIDVPLRTDSDGIIRIGESRVALQTLIAAFHQGASPEEIVHQYPALNLADVYVVVGYYLQYRAEIDTYVAEQQQLANEARREYETRVAQDPLRAQLLQRFAEQASKT